jgi:hypothetical protein
LTPVIPLDETLALAEADVALKEGFAMAETMIVSAERSNNCKIITSDVDLKNQTGVEYIPTN